MMMQDGNRIDATVGAGGANRPSDVTIVQRLLNLRVGLLDVGPLPVNGVATRETLRAIRNYRIRALRLPGSGVIDPRSPALAALNDTDPMALTHERAVVWKARRMLSGAGWMAAHLHRFPDSSRIADLHPGFADSVGAFVGALRRSRVTVRITAAYRHPIRAWLMHHAWRLATGDITVDEIEPLPAAGIIWDHGDARLTIVAAQQMVERFGLVERPSLESLHIGGDAVDMDARWSEPIQLSDAHGCLHRIDHPRDGRANAAFEQVAATYGLRKMAMRPAHWSRTGD